MRGRIFKSTGSWYEVHTKEQEIFHCRLRGKIKLQNLKVTNPIAVGDLVDFLPEENQGQTGVITEILKRKNYIIRKSTQKSKQRHIIAANIDQAVLLATLSFPKTSLGFIDRFLVTAETFRIPVVIIFNKADLLTEKEKNKQKELALIYESIGYPCQLISAIQDRGIEKFHQIINNKISLISGHSGVGKSTLLNRVVPFAEQKVSDLSTFANKGVHTTTFAEMFRIDRDTYVIDTPGIKELGLVDIENEELSHYFPEMRELLGKCKFHNCIHIHEPGCIIKAAIKNGSIHESRYNSYLSMLENEDNRR